MKYGLGIRILLSFMAGGVAILYKIRLNPIANQSEISSVINVPRQFLFDVVTEPSNVPAYFSWITRLRSPDKRNVVHGKRYRGIVNMPFFGQHQVQYVVTDCQDGSWMVLKPDKKDASYFNTEVVLMLNSISKTQTQFHMKIIYHRNSALFQFTLGPLLKWLTDQQLRRTAFNVRALAMSKYKTLSDNKPVLDKAHNHLHQHRLLKDPGTSSSSRSSGLGFGMSSINPGTGTGTGPGPSPSPSRSKERSSGTNETATTKATRATATTAAERTEGRIVVTGGGSGRSSVKKYGQKVDL